MCKKNPRFIGTTYMLYLLLTLGYNIQYINCGEI